MTEYLLRLRKEVESHIDHLALPKEPANVYEPMHYLLGLPGKRIRPILTLMAAELMGAKPLEAMPQALAVEIFHNFTLVHDDIMDSADKRRGLPTVHKKWDHNIALLSGDGMLVIAYQYLMQASPEKLAALAQVFSSTALEVCEGQQLDMDYATREDVSEEHYMEMIKLKTAVLLGGAMRLGAIVAGASEQQQIELDRFAVNLGLAFQIRDDYLDAFGSEAFGKKIGGDILEGKRTWLTIRAYEKASEDQRKALHRAYNELQGDQRIEEVLRLYTELDIKSDADAKIKHFSAISTQALDQVNGDQRMLEELKRLVDYLMGREQ
jgi:geranylgeranyl diphosphate synthase type II